MINKFDTQIQFMICRQIVNLVYFSFFQTWKWKGKIMNYVVRKKYKFSYFIFILFFPKSIFYFILKYFKIYFYFIFFSNSGFIMELFYDSRLSLIWVIAGWVWILSSPNHRLHTGLCWFIRNKLTIAYIVFIAIFC